MASVDSMMYSPGNDAFYTDDLRAVLEDHLTYLRNHPSTVNLPVVAKDLYRFEADLYGLFFTMQIPPEYHFTIMRVNGWDSPLKTPDNLTNLIIPPYSEIDKIRQAHTTSRRVT
jgi:hypothetical protein